MIPTCFVRWNTSWKSLAFASILLFLVMALACESPVNPEPSNPPGTGWLVWDNASFRPVLTNFTIQRNTISFNLTGGYHNGCVPQTTFTHSLNGNIFTVKAFYRLTDSGRVCTQAGAPFTLRVFLTASTGTYRVVLRPTPLSRAFDTTVTVP